MYKASIKDQSFNIDLSNNTMVLNGENYLLSLTPLDDGGYEAILNGNKVVADIVRIDYELKQVVLRIQNKRYTVQIKEPVDILLESLGIQTKVSKKVNNLKAPMPGLVTKLLVKEGDHVNQGEPLLILEAMKMENVFKAATDVKIKSVKVSERQAVEKGEELIAFE
jgi:biotin carboxyl carrier protein